MASLQVDIELFPMPKPDQRVNEEGEPLPPKFEIRDFYANVITMDEDEMGYADMMLGIDGA